MNILPQEKVAELRSAFDRGLSTREAARVTNINRETSGAYFRDWRAKRGPFAGLSDDMIDARIASAHGDERQALLQERLRRDLEKWVWRIGEDRAEAILRLIKRHD